MEEIFVPVKGYEELYEVSNFGNVKALQRVAPNHIFGTMVMKEKFLKVAVPHHSGYIYVHLSKNKIRTGYAVHRLVAAAFIDNPNNLREVNHKDCIKTNNNVLNLEWCDRKFNQNHAMENGRGVINFGEKHGMSVLTKKTVLEMRRIYNTQRQGYRKKYSYRKIAKMYNISSPCAYAAINKITWAHV